MHRYSQELHHGRLISDFFHNDDGYLSLHSWLPPVRSHYEMWDQFPICFFPISIFIVFSFSLVISCSVCIVSVSHIFKFFGVVLDPWQIKPANLVWVATQIFSITSEVQFPLCFFPVSLFIVFSIDLVISCSVCQKNFSLTRQSSNNLRILTWNLLLIWVDANYWQKHQVDWIWLQISSWMWLLKNIIRKT
jgi:hypothetical protein